MRLPTLRTNGWQRRFMGTPPRLDEVVELYRELGHEVRVEQVEEQDLADHCRGCRLALALFRVVYTKERA